MSSQNVHIPTWLIPCGFLFYLVVNITSWNFPFFWDTLLTSTITSWYFENGLTKAPLPTHIDAGHPPLFYTYLLSWWKVLGKSLYASHVAMLPVLWIMFYQFVQLSSRWLTSISGLVAAAALFCIETTILAQSTLVSYDIVLLCLYLCALRYALDKRPVEAGIAAAALSLVSIRGLFAIAAVILTELMILRSDRRRWRVVWKYLPALLLFAAWNFLHLKMTGWMLFTPSEQWEGHRGFAGVGGMAHNLMVVVRVLLEPGRVALYLLLFLGILRRYRIGQLDTLYNPLILAGAPLLVFTLAFLPFNNPIGHRYYMVIFALSILLFSRMAEQWKPRRLAVAAVAICLVSGHFWVYPPGISKGWDASLAFTPYFKAKKSMDQYLSDRSIPVTDLAAHFPLDVSGDQYLLNGQKLRPAEFETADTLHFVLESNINNDFSEAELLWLKKNCLVIHEEKRHWVAIRLHDCSGEIRQ